MAADRDGTPTLDSPTRGLPRNRSSSPLEDGEGMRWGGDEGQRRRSRSRSRSRERIDRRHWKLTRRDRQRVYDAEGTNTIRQEAHLRRARLFVGNVDPVRVHRRDILHRFQEYGEVMGISLHQGYAFVQMDSERNANRAVNFENGAKINSTRLHVEFSSAALNAGARFKPLPLEERSPVRELGPPSSSVLEQDDRLSRVLSLQRELDRELAYLVGSSKEEFDSVPSRNRANLDTGFDTHYDGYTRVASPPTRGNYSRGREEFYERREYPARPFSSRPPAGSSRGFADRGMMRERGFDSSRYGGYSASHSYGGDGGWSAPERGYAGSSWR